MKRSLALDLHGKDWWKAFLPVWIVYLAYLAFNLAEQRSVTPGTEGAFLLGGFVLMVLLMAVVSVFAIVALRIILPRLSLGGHTLAFHGSSGRFLGLNLLGFLLTLVTLGFYGPWYLRRVLAYLCAETRLDGEAPTFHGKPGKLLAYFLLGFWLPFAVLLGGLFLTLGPGGSHGLLPSTSQVLVSLVFMALMVVALIPFMYLVYRWYVDLGWRDLRLSWRTDFWDACLYLLGQICLTVVTLGIYWPAAFLRLYRYFAARTVLQKEGSDLGHLSFEGPIGQGFGLLWGQTLLMVITLGFYLPWAYARIGRWMVAATVYEGEDPLGGTRVEDVPVSG